MNTDLSPLQKNLPLKFESVQLQGFVNGFSIQELIGGQKEGN